MRAGKKVRTARKEKVKKKRFLRFKKVTIIFFFYPMDKKKSFHRYIFQTLSTLFLSLDNFPYFCFFVSIGRICILKSSHSIKSYTLKELQKRMHRALCHWRAMYNRTVCCIQIITQYKCINV